MEPAVYRISPECDFHATTLKLVKIFMHDLIMNRLERTGNIIHPCETPVATINHVNLSPFCFITQPACRSTISQVTASCKAEFFSSLA